MISKFKKYKLRLFNTIYKLYLKKNYKSFVNSLDNHEKYQKKLLFKILNKNKNTLYGTKYDFKNIKCIEDFQNKVPIVDYENIIEYITKIRDGQTNCLTQENVVMFEKTSGSTFNSKYIPYTKSVIHEINKGASVWIYDLYKFNPGLLNKSSYWSISPSFGSYEKTKCGIPIGFRNDSEYFTPIEKFFLNQIFSVDTNVAKLDQSTFKMETSVQLLLDENLGFISVWSPTFLIILLEYIEENKFKILLKVKEKKIFRYDRIKKLEEIFNQSKVNFENVWPNLELISCWTDGNSARYIDELKKKFPRSKIQGKGLLLTEGIVSIPVMNLDAPILSITSHFFEFIDPEFDKKILLPHELEPNKTYIPVITTSGGLYRYKTNDLIKVIGLFKSTPLFKLVGRANNVVDYFGEKINEMFVSNIISTIIGKHKINPKFIFLAPVIEDKPHYALFIEDKSLLKNEIEISLENLLCENHNYKKCRNLNQLYKASVYYIDNGMKIYEKTLAQKRSSKPGDVKFSVLDKNIFWKEVFNSRQ